MSNDLVTLPPNVTSRGLDVAMWNTLCNSLFPGAKADSVLMAVDYCKARQLDVMKKPCHIVPISVKTADGGWTTRDVIMPGIYEYRITAHRTKQYLGHDKPMYGDELDFAGVTAPEWCEMTIRRIHESGQIVEYPQRVYFREVCATKRDRESGKQTANERWSKAPIQMLTKCTEAAGLREAFPDELGGTYTEDEMYGKAIDVTPAEATASVTGGRASTGEQHPGATGRGPAGARSGRSKPPVKEPTAEDTGGEDPPITAGAPAGGDDRIIKSQQTLIEQRLKRANIPVTEFCAHFEIGEIKELPFDDMQRASEWIAARSEGQS